MVKRNTVKWTIYLKTLAGYLPPLEVDSKETVGNIKAAIVERDFPDAYAVRLMKLNNDGSFIEFTNNTAKLHTVIKDKDELSVFIISVDEVLESAISRIRAPESIRGLYLRQNEVMNTYDAVPMESVEQLAKLDMSPWAASSIPYNEFFGKNNPIKEPYRWPAVILFIALDAEKTTYLQFAAFADMYSKPPMVVLKNVHSIAMERWLFNHAARNTQLEIFEALHEGIYRLPASTMSWFIKRDRALIRPRCIIRGVDVMADDAFSNRNKPIYIQYKDNDNTILYTQNITEEVLSMIRAPSVSNASHGGRRTRRRHMKKRKTLRK